MESDTGGAGLEVGGQATENVGEVATAKKRDKRANRADAGDSPLTESPARTQSLGLT